MDNIEHDDLTVSGYNRYDPREEPTNRTSDRVPAIFNKLTGTCRLLITVKHLIFRVTFISRANSLGHIHEIFIFTNVNFCIIIFTRETFVRIDFRVSIVLRIYTKIKSSRIKMCAVVRYRVRRKSIAT